MYENDFERFSKKDIPGIILSSLLYNNLPEQIESLDIYRDGNISVSQKIRAKEIISEYLNIEKK